MGRLIPCFDDRSYSLYGHLNPEVDAKDIAAREDSDQPGILNHGQPPEVVREDDRARFVEAGIGPH